MMKSIDPTTKKKIVVCGMSGGVDSSTTALLLKQAGYEVIGVYLHFWYEANLAERRSISEDRCCSIDGQADARRVARQIGIPFYTLNFSQIFKTEVVDYFLDKYKSGSTPNPCIKCNKHIKFGLFMQKAQEIFKADYVATGHYARVARREDGAYELQKAVDEKKDQSYFLYNLTQEKLARVLFPLGDLRKAEVREIAERNGLVVARKAESQGLCFLRESQHYGFLRRNLEEQVEPGDIVDDHGRVLGQHNGLPLYTLGQREGINIGGTGPYYVTHMNYGKNTLHVSNNRLDPRMFKKKIVLDEVNILAAGGSEMLSAPLAVQVRVRHGHAPAPATAWLETEGDRVVIEFDEPQRAVMRGQSAVLYQDDRVIGGGAVAETFSEISPAPQVEPSRKIAYNEVN